MNNSETGALSGEFPFLRGHRPGVRQLSTTVRGVLFSQHGVFSKTSGMSCLQLKVLRLHMTFGMPGFSWKVRSPGNTAPSSHRPSPLWGPGGFRVPPRSTMAWHLHSPPEAVSPSCLPWGLIARSKVPRHGWGWVKALSASRKRCSVLPVSPREQLHGGDNTGFHLN